MTIMGDKDIPSVPITTLSGLTSISDLLSELPVSESYSNVSSLNKSLLFHTLVAEESKNLLSVKDDHLVRQLVLAIEQTNAENIELKSQFAINQTQINIREYPELLKGIYTFRPTVFNTPLKNENQHKKQILNQQSNQIEDIKKSSKQIFSISKILPADVSTVNSNKNQKKSERITEAPKSTVVSIEKNVPKRLGVVKSNIAVDPPDKIHVDTKVSKNDLQQINISQIASISKTISSNSSNLNESQKISENSVLKNNTNLEHFPVKETEHKDINLLDPKISLVENKRNVQDGNTENKTNICSITKISAENVKTTNSVPIELNSKETIVTNTLNSGKNEDKTLEPGTINISKDLTFENMNNCSLDQNIKTEKEILTIQPSSTSCSIQESNAKPRNKKGKIRLSKFRKCKVRIRKLKEKHSKLILKDIKEFSKKCPSLAKELGLVNDVFSQIKADEKKGIIKRKSVYIAQDAISPENVISKPKLRRIERFNVSNIAKTSKDEFQKSQIYQQFIKNIDSVIELLDDTEQPNYNSEEIDETIEPISSKMLHILSNDVAKLKAKGALDLIPKNKLTLLVSYSMRSIYLAKNYSCALDMDDEIFDDEVMEKVLNGIEATLLICNIYSTVEDLKFLQEDNIALIIKFIQFQLRESIFPSYDPVYVVKNMKKSSDSRKKSKSHLSHNRSLQLFYSKVVELMKVLVNLFEKTVFVDTIVLPLSTLAIEPFFVDNIETLQFVCLELVTTLFRKEQYVNMRSSILADILASIDRLPCSKKNMRPFKLANNGGNIQMITALILQLIQCATILPESLNEKNKKLKSVSTKNDATEEIDSKSRGDKDMIFLEKYDTALSIGGNFLTTFLNKCKSKANETDFRPLFENFIHDLLSTVNRPEWPAAELLLSLLGTLLVKYMSDKSIEQAIRLASLDYLGIVAARLRKDTCESRCKVNVMDTMIKSIKEEQEKEGDIEKKENDFTLDPEEERIQFLQDILLDFLTVNAQEDNLIWDYAKNFYLVQWYRDLIQQKKRISEGGKNFAYRKKKNVSNRTNRKREAEKSESEENSIEEISEDSAEEKNKTVDFKLNLEIFKAIEERKNYLVNKKKMFQHNSGNALQYFKTYIDYNNAHLIAQYLANRRPFSQSFDIYLQKIILVVREPAIAIRTRAMKCLANIVEVDPLILKRKDMQMGVNQKFLDTAISVREAAVDLIGKYVLSSEDLIGQYYEMLSKRILDTGVSVRKRVIKILRDICIEYPDFDRIPEICVKMIRRVNDEEGIQKLVTEVFMSMWFSPCVANDKIAVYRKINQIIDVVNTAHDTGTLWLDGLLTSIFTPKDNIVKAETSADIIKKNTEPPAEVVLACQQLADGLVERLIELEDTDNDRMLGCITTIHLLAKARPKLLVKHAITIEPYLNIKCHSTVAPKFICSVAEILELVVPLMEHPSDSFLADLEGHLMMLVVSLNQKVVASCVSCLGSVVNKITKNYKLIRDCFSKFHKSISNSIDQLKRNPSLPMDSIYQPIFRRSLYTIGILMRFFDFKSSKVLGIEEGDKISTNICDEVFDSLMFFITGSSLEIRKQALVSLGFFCIQNDDYLTRPELRDFYCDILVSSSVEPYIKSCCMRNIWMYLTESEINMFNKEKDWEKQSQFDDLKEMNDVSSGMASRIIQLYLNGILKCFLHEDQNVRLWAVKVVQIVLRQGLVHPVIVVPYLIALSTDEKQETSHRADHLLKELDKTYTGFVNMKVQQGLELSFQLQDVLQCVSNQEVIRGYAKRENQMVALCDFLYSLLRNTKPQRRALVQTIIKQFDDQKTTLRQMLFLADNLAYFPYVVQDEPLYLIHQIDIVVSNTGTTLLTNFREGLKPARTNVENSDCKQILEDDEDDDEEDKELLYERLPEDTKDLQQCVVSAQGCMLLLLLKQHLKDMYGLTDGKISRYSPSEPKIYEKAISRKTVSDFQPKSTIDVIKKGKDIYKELNDNEKRDLIDKYLNFKQLMLRLDPDDADSEFDGENKSKQNVSGEQCNIDNNANTTSVIVKNEIKISEKQPTDSQQIQTHNDQQEILSNAPSNRVTKVLKPLNQSKKLPKRSTRKRKKIMSSGDEDSNYSDDD